MSFLSRTKTDNIFYPVNPTNTGGDQSTLSFTVSFLTLSKILSRYIQMTTKLKHYVVHLQIPRVLFSDSGLLEFEFSHPVDPVQDFSFSDVTNYTALTELQYSVTINGTTKVFQGDVKFSSRTVQGEDANILYFRYKSHNVNTRNCILDIFTASKRSLG